MAAAQRIAIEPFLQYLERHRVPFCILHPFAERGFTTETDVDLFIDRSRLDVACEYLASSGWHRVTSFRFASFRRHYSKVVSGFKVKLDISTAFAVYTSNRLHRFAGTVEPKIGSDGHPYLDDFAGFCLIAKKGIEKGGLTPSKLVDLETLAEREPAILARFGSLIEQRTSEFPVTLDRYFHRAGTISLSVLPLLRAYAQRICLASAPTVVSLVGLDGAGKGTYLPLVLQRLTDSQLDARLCYFGFSQFSLRPLATVVKLRSNPRLSRLRPLFSAVYFGLLPLDFVFRRGRGHYDVIVTDRHPLYEPVFARGLGRFYDRLLQSCCPTPTLTVYLSGDAPTVWSRKRDGSLATYMSRKTALDALVASRSAAIQTVTIDTTGSIPSVFDAIWEAVRAHI